MFTASGINITVGMYSYFLTNMLGLSLIYLAIGFLFRIIKNGNESDLIFATLFGSLTVFTHPWTFTQYYVTTILFFVFMYFKEKNIKKYLKILLFLVITGFADIIKGAMGGLEVYGTIASRSPNIIELTRFWSNNIFAFRQMYGGLISNTVFIGIALLGFYLFNERMHFKLFLIILLMTSFIYYLMVDGSAQTKLLYNIPLSVYGALGILFIVRDIVIERRKKIMVLSFLIIYMMVYFFRSLGNFF